MFTTESFEARLAAALRRAFGQVQGATLLVAVSGGADSTAMLVALAALREKGGFALQCIHVEHGIRPANESLADAQAVLALCEKLNVLCKVVSIPQGKVAAFASKGGPGIEGAARYFRHRAFRREARRINADSILTAHTRDDLLENLLMRILRGSGPAGLAAMPQRRGRLLRPLLDISRQDVIGYLKEKGFSYRIDSTNSDINFLRNRVRHKLIPVLDEFFPHWRSSLLALAETQSLCAEFLASEVEKRLPWKPGMDSTLKLREEDFLAAPQILREEAIFIGTDILMAQCSNNPPGNPPRRSAVRNTSKQLGAAHIKARACDLGPIRFDKQNGFITLSSACKTRAARRFSGERGFSLLINEAGSYTLEGKLLGLGKNSGLCIRVGTLANFPLVFRNHQEGDRIFRGLHKHRFSDILGKAIRSVCFKVITACDADGTVAFIGLTHDGDIIISNREQAETGLIEVSWKRSFRENPLLEGKNV